MRRHHYRIEEMPDLSSGACAPVGTNLFFEQEYESAAKAVCKMCPVAVRKACLDWALSKPEPFGVWGGLSEDERADRKQPPCTHCLDAPSHAKGLCQNCYNYQYKYGALPSLGVLANRAQPARINDNGVKTYHPAAMSTTLPTDRHGGLRLVKGPK